MDIKNTILAADGAYIGAVPRKQMRLSVWPLLIALVLVVVPAMPSLREQLSPLLRFVLYAIGITLPTLCFGVCHTLRNKKAQKMYIYELPGVTTLIIGDGCMLENSNVIDKIAIKNGVYTDATENGEYRLSLIVACDKKLQGGSCLLQFCLPEDDNRAKLIRNTFPQAKAEENT